MKIVYLRSNPVDPDPRVEKEVSSALKAGYDVEIVAWNREKNSKKVNVSDKIINDKKVKVTRRNISAGFGSGLRNIFPLVRWQLFLISWLFKNSKNIDLVHASDFDTVIPAYLLKKIKRKPYVYDIYDFYIDSFTVPNFLKGIIKAIDFKMIKNAECTIITNEQRYDQIKGSKPRDTVVIHNTPIMKDNFEVVNFEIGTKMKIFYGGVLQDGRMIKEMIEIVSNNDNLELTIAGFGKLENYCKHSAEINSNINFIGKIDYSEILKISNDSNVIFAVYDPNIPNHKYSSPNKLYEAMMLSKPIIVCENTGIDVIVKQEKTGCVCKYNIDSLKNCLEYIYSNPQEANAMGMRSKVLYDDKYSWEIMSDKLLEVYRKINNSGEVYR